MHRRELESELAGYASDFESIESILDDDSLTDAQQVDEIRSVVIGDEDTDGNDDADDDA